MKKTLVTLGVIGTLAGGGTYTADQIANPYEDKGQTLEIKAESTITDAGEVKAELSKAEPAITLSKWNGEAAMTVKYEGVQATGERAFLTDRMEWKDGAQEVHAFPLEASAGVGEDGGFEIEVILNEKPDTNVFNFTIDGAQDLDFSYQPETFQEGITQSENIIGSYAVYYKGKKEHIGGKTNYATGKAYHIYRPKAFDANGDTVWAELHYNDGILSVTVPQDFLNKATYPVTVDPTFGYTSCGSNFFSAGTAIFGAGYAPSSSGTLTTVSVCYKRAGPGNAIGSLYTDGTTGNLIAESAEATIPTAAAATFYDFPVSASITSGVTYILTYVTDNNVTPATNVVAFDFVATIRKAKTSYTYVSPMPSSISWNVNNVDANLSMYGTYTTAGSPASVGTFIISDE